MYRIHDDNEDNFNRFKNVSLEILDSFPSHDKTKSINSKDLLNQTDLIYRRFGRIPECYKSAV